ncbi:MAG: dienelactone hydrolase family protein [Chloroflexi bacterium]|nr:dienelactone hydrolase family protein [Chloroflexota bacterium]
MVEGIDRFLMREIERSVAERPKLWQRDFSSRDAYEKSVQPNRDRLRRYIGAVDQRVPVAALEFVSRTAVPAKIAETDKYTVFAVRWPVFAGVYSEGLLLQPKAELVARVVAIPDADQTPEMLAGLAPGLGAEAQFARRLAEQGCQVVVPVLIDRQDTWSGNPELGRFTNQPHREWIYRQAYQMGRHIIGYEVQKILAAVDWFQQEQTRNPASNTRKAKIAVAGYAEGGLMAFYAAALDTRIDAALASGYFTSRQHVWEEPIYRNVFALLREFGDAEIAGLIAPRALIVEYSPVPQIDGPPQPRQGRGGAAPGWLATPDRLLVEAEVRRARAFFPASFSFPLEFIYGNEGMTVGPGSNPALAALLKALGISGELRPPAAGPLADARGLVEPSDRQRRQIEQLVNHTQRLLSVSERVRHDFFWRKIKPASPEEWAKGCIEFKEVFWEEVIGRFPKASLPANPRARQIHDEAKWTGYEVVLDVWPDVLAWGYLLLPKDLQPGERRPVVVCQHGLEGVPADTISGPGQGGYPAYKSFAARLAEQGFITFAPHNPYRGQDKFRVLQRKANPLKKSLFSIILAQHDRILDWLSDLPFVDPQRIGFYGLSYGGKTAMRVPSLLDRYCLSICSADFNEWIKKNATVDSPYSYMLTGEYEMPEFNLGHTFNYAEMAALIAPRPFMVERGHNDGVAPDEWVAYEFAKVRRLYAYLGIPERTAIEFFNGPHTINGVGTFEFLCRHLHWPPR